MTPTDIKPPPCKTYFQEFRVSGENEHTLIPAVEHPITNDLYVIWSDITDCFPGVTKIQYANVYVPKLRDTRLYRVKPWGIRYHAGIVLDVVFGKRASFVNRISNKSNNSRSIGVQTVGFREEEHCAGVVVNGEGGDKGASDSGQDDGSSAGRDDKYSSGDEKDECDDENDEGGGDDGDSVDREQQSMTEEQVDGARDSDSISDMSSEQAPEQAVERTAEDAVIAPTTDFHHVTDDDNDDDDDGEQEETEQDKEDKMKERQVEEEEEKEEQEEEDEAEEEAEEEVAEDEDEEEKEEEEGEEAEEEVKEAEEGEKEEESSVVQEESSSVESPVVHIHQEMPLTIDSLVKHRVKNILKSQYSWAQQCGHSRFFVFLPVLEPATTYLRITTTVTTISTPATTPATGVHKNTKFQLYYLCDCYEIQGSTEKITPHWVNKNGIDDISIPSAEDLYQQQLRTLIPLVGDYTMGVLEMLKYGVYIDKAPREVSQRVDMAIKYLETRGIRSCESYMAEITSDPASAVGEVMLDRVPTIAVLDVEILEAFKSGIVRSPYERYGEMFPYRTLEGDIRWLCGYHWMDTWKYMGYYSRALSFKDNPMSSESRYDPIYGIVSSRVKSMKRAREFFDMVQHMARNPVFTIWLDCDLTLDDEAELAKMIGRLSVAVINIIARERKGSQEEIDTGMEYGQLEMTAAALRNPDIELFTVSEAERGKEYVYNQLPNMLNVHLAYEPKSKDRITAVERGVRGGKVKMFVRATNAGRAIAEMRRITGGMHHFSELRFGPNHHRFVITLAPDSAGEMGCDVKDTDLSREGLMSFLDRRQWRDEIVYASSIPYGTKYLYLGYITKADIKILLARAGSEVRDLITHNKHLRSLTVNVVTLDYEPSRIYETYKDLISEHPTIEAFVIQFQRIKGTSSSFRWRNLTDAANVRVDVSCGRGDNVEAMFQRYAPLIERLRVHDLSPKDAAALIKSVRRKKKPLALKYLSINDIHLMDPAVREILQEVIVKGNLSDVVIRGCVIPLPVPVAKVGKAMKAIQPRLSGKKEVSTQAAKLEANVKIWADFIVAIRHKVTELYLQDDPERRFLQAMELQPVMLPEMTGLTTFHLTSTTPAGTSLFDRPWLEVLLEFKGPVPHDIDVPDEDPLEVRVKEIFALRSQMTDVRAITDLCLQEVSMDPEDWDPLLRYMDFTQVVSFEVRQTNVLSKALLLHIARFVPLDSTVLKHFVVSDGVGIGDETATALGEKLGPKIFKGTHINLNGFVV
ncbi:MAG: hypothetical protein JOS17DRAFT_726062 [Linnemannia elongata]|nr:MAG: hypothetical protein JOS17DRAFT_726062 [Linnemannia elongata]